MAISRMQEPQQIQSGIGSLQEPRQRYFLGKLVKKAVRGVKKIVKRKGANIGDVICTTGAFGYTSSALQIMLKKKKASRQFTAKAKRLFFRPNPRIEFAHNYYRIQFGRI